MRKTITEIYIEVEEIVVVRKKDQKTERGNKAGEKENSDPVIEICPHCGKAIFERRKNNLGEKKS